MNNNVLASRIHFHVSPCSRAIFIATTEVWVAGIDDKDAKVEQT